MQFSTCEDLVELIPLEIETKPFLSDYATTKYHWKILDLNFSIFHNFEQVYGVNICFPSIISLSIGK